MDSMHLRVGGGFGDSGEDWSVHFLKELLEPAALASSEGPVQWELGDLKQWDYTCANNHRPIQLRTIDGLDCPLCVSAPTFEEPLRAAVQAFLDYLPNETAKVSLALAEKIMHMRDALVAAAPPPTASFRTRARITVEMVELAFDDWHSPHKQVGFVSRSEFIAAHLTDALAGAEKLAGEQAIKLTPRQWRKVADEHEEDEPQKDIEKGLK